LNIALKYLKVGHFFFFKAFLFYLFVVFCRVFKTVNIPNIKKDQTLNMNEM